jgi:muconate cycloisomerase
MSKIVKVSASIVDIPTTRPHKLSFTTLTSMSFVIVRVESADGAVGWGEAATIGGAAWNEESPESILHAIESYLAPCVLNQPIQAITAMVRAMEIRCKGNYFAKSAVEQALIDAYARELGVYAGALLGGATAIPLPVAWTLASGDTQRDIAEAERVLERKEHRVFKIKIGANTPASDLAHVGAIARALSGRHEAIIVDVNQAWDLNTALEFTPRLAHAGVNIIEQPTKRANEGGLALLTQLLHGKCLVMADESICSPQDAIELVKQKAGHIFSLKIAKHGGLLRTKEVCAIASAAEIDWYGGTMLETSLGSAASLCVFSALPASRHGCELFGPKLIVDDIVDAPLQYANFSVALPPAAKTIGFGVTVDPKKVKRFDRARSGLNPVIVDFVKNAVNR